MWCVTDRFLDFQSFQPLKLDNFINHFIISHICMSKILTKEDCTDRGKSEFPRARWRLKTCYFTEYFWTPQTFYTLWQFHQIFYRNFSETLRHLKYVLAWAVQSSLYQHKSPRKEDSGTGYKQKADWKRSKLTWDRKSVV